MAKAKKVPDTYVVHPGAILRDFIKQISGLNVSGLAQQIGVPVTRLHEIVHGRRAITADTAVRLATYSQCTYSAFEWMERQAEYDIYRAAEIIGVKM